MQLEPQPNEETYDDWLLRTSVEAQTEAEKNGYLTSEEVEAEIAKHKHDYFKKQKKAA